MNKKKIEKAIRDILIAIGENPDREGLKRTPARVAEMYEEILGGIRKNVKKEIKIQHAEYDEIVLIRDIPLYSICEHHMVPFVGKAHVGYLPKDGRVTGLSKLVRVVDTLSRRLQVQERLTVEIADTLMEVLKPLGVIVILEAEHLCYDEKTEIFTNMGWKKFSDLKDELVAQVNTETLELTFSEPLAKVGYYYKGDMHRYKSDCIDMLVTPDHRMIIQSEWQFYKGKQKWKIMPASLIPKTGKYIIPQSCSWSGVSIKRKKLGGRLLGGDDYCRFMGIWLSEGCTYIKPNKKGYMVVVSQKEGEVARNIRKLFNRLPWNWWEGIGNKKSGVKQFIICDKFLHRDLAVFRKSGDKFVPRDIRNATRNQLELFLEWYGKGDGHRYKHNPLKWHYVSKSKRLIEDMQEIFIKLGIGGSVQYYDNCARLENRVNKRKNGAGIKGYGMLEPRHRSIVRYEGMVYCVTVPMGAVVVRRNGRIAVSGNCISMRGVQKPGTITKTSAVKGVFRDDRTTRAEALSLIYGGTNVV